jgi:hypothetical protein
MRVVQATVPLSRCLGSSGFAAPRTPPLALEDAQRSSCCRLTLNPPPSPADAYSCATVTARRSCVRRAAGVLILIVAAFPPRSPRYGRQLPAMAAHPALAGDPR